ncbi:hypothetical protein Vi05172_g10117 [Venturia inaequalis]|nr:hypothetical protein Vi05172_g10117 [Venturia inaequalis]
MFFNTSSIVVMLSALLIATTNAAPSAQQNWTCFATQSACETAHHRDCWNLPNQKTNGKPTPWCYYQ